jgi:hypothetical protein
VLSHLPVAKRDPKAPECDTECDTGKAAKLSHLPVRKRGSRAPQSDTESDTANVIPLGRAGDPVPRGRGFPQGHAIAGGA